MAKQPPQPGGPRMPPWLRTLWRGRRGTWPVRRMLQTILLSVPLVAVLFTIAISALRWPMPLRLVGIGAVGLGLVMLFFAVRASVRLVSHLGAAPFVIVGLVGYVVVVIYTGMTTPSGERGLWHWGTTVGTVAGDAWRGLQRGLRGLWRAPGEVAFTATGQRAPVPLPGVEWPGGVPPTPIVIRADGSQPAPAAPPATPIIPSSRPRDLQPGDQVQVVGTEGAALRGRAAPSTSADIVVRFPPGAVLEIVAGPERVDGRDWWQVRGEQGEGWCAGEYLQPIE